MKVKEKSLKTPYQPFTPLLAPLSRQNDDGGDLSVQRYNLYMDKINMLYILFAILAQATEVLLSAMIHHTANLLLASACMCPI